MYPRRILAGLAAASAALLLASCAGDSLDSDPADETDAGVGGGKIRISGQNFPEATLVAEMYAQILSANGYEPEVKLVDTRDVYMADFPGGIDLVPEYVGGIVDFLNAKVNGDDAEPITTADAAETIESAQELLVDQGITLLDASMATDTNAFFVTKEYAEAEGVTTLSDMEGKSVVLAAAPDCEGRTDCAGGLTDVYGIKITEILPLGFASNETYKSVIDGESQLGAHVHDGRHAGVAGSGAARGRPAHPAVPEPRAGHLHRVLQEPPGRRGAAGPADGGADDRGPDQAQRPGLGRPREA